MAELIELFLAIWQTAVAVFVIIYTINAGIQYKKKKSKVAMHLFVAFIMLSIAAIAQCTPTIWNYFIETGPPITEIHWLDAYIIQQWHVWHFAYFFLATGVYFLYLFSLDLIYVDRPRWGARIIPALFIPAIVIYGMFIKALIDTGGNLALDLLVNIDIWVGIYIVALMIPLLVDLVRVRGQLDSANPMHKRFMYLIIYASSLIVMIICFVIETFIESQPNVFSFLAWTFAVSALFFSYMGLYRKK